MKITTLETYLLSAPLPQAVRTSTHTFTRVSEVIVKLTTDAGLVGIGEAHGPFLFQQGPDGLRIVQQIGDNEASFQRFLDEFRALLFNAYPSDVYRSLRRQEGGK